MCVRRVRKIMTEVRADRNYLARNATRYITCGVKRFSFSVHLHCLSRVSVSELGMKRETRDLEREKEKSEYKKAVLSQGNRAIPPGASRQSHDATFPFCSCPSLPFSLPFPSLPSLPLSFPSLPLEVGPLKSS